MPAPPPAKKSRTNTPWTPAEEQRLKQMRDMGNSWAEIAKVSCFAQEMMKFLLTVWPDFPYSYRGQCQEALVQRYALC